MPRSAGVFAALLICSSQPAFSQQSQNPSPMVEHTRLHPRLTQENVAGQREALELGTLFIPSHLKAKTQTPLVLHFHGPAWLAEMAAARCAVAVVAIHIAPGSSNYAEAFSDRGRFGKIIDEAARKSGRRFGPIVLSCWSAGYGAIREILQVPEYYERVGGILLIDGLHTDYVGGTPGPLESQLQTQKLDVFLRFARDSAAGKKRMVVTHSEIFPGTFASTTETADYLLREIGLPRLPLLRWGPMHMQQLSEAKRGGFVLAGYAGNSAPDHVDQLHALATFLKWTLW